MKKIAIFISLLVIFGHSVHAKENPFVVGLGYVVGKKTVQDWRWKSMDRFTDSYNINMRGNLKEPLSYLTMDGGFNQGVEFQLLCLFYNLNWSKQTGSSSATLLSGEKREFRLDMNTFSMGFDIMAPIKGFVDIGMNLGLIINKGYLKSGYRYNNGTLSYAEDKYLNGVYQIRNTGNYSIGPRIDVGYKWVKLSFKAEYAFTGKNTSENLLPAYDPMAYSAQSSIFDDGSLHIYLPERFEDQDNVYSYAIGNKDCIFGGFTGWSFTYTIKLSPLYFSNFD